MADTENKYSASCKESSPKERSSKTKILDDQRNSLKMQERKTRKGTEKYKEIDKDIRYLTIIELACMYHMC